MPAQKGASAEVAAKRRERVLFMRAAGIEVHEIAADLGVSKQRVYMILKRATEPDSSRSDSRRRPSSKITVTVADVQRFLGKSKRAFYLLRRNATEEFPAPFLIQGRDHWLMRDLLEWIESRRRRDAVPGRTALSSGDRAEVLDGPEP